MSVNPLSVLGAMIVVGAATSALGVLVWRRLSTAI